MENYLLKTLHHLRYYEELLLFGRVLEVSAGHRQEAVVWLGKAYSSESSTWPHAVPPFAPDAALWAAQLLYTAAQLILHRELRPRDAAALLPAYTGTPSPSEVLSADLTLRFLPDVLTQLRLIDPEDALLPLLEDRLAHFHFSGVGYALPPERLNWTSVAESPCLRALYADRVIARGALVLASTPALRPSVEAALGLYAPELWPAFVNQTHAHDPHR
ncbi:hypothetical protein [Flaviaesturariibacter amylovorans]|uniref:MoxR-vWA-beta-propeller ternary system domain-containing protein n=1 Tax=Flaviaesturariibacter amylovorans TaxID=1084520 RepID=A0ABP8HKK6_9BACT